LAHGYPLVLIATYAEEFICFALVFYESFFSLPDFAEAEKKQPWLLTNNARFSAADLHYGSGIANLGRENTHAHVVGLHR